MADLPNQYMPNLREQVQWYEAVIEAIMFSSSHGKKASQESWGY